MLEGKSGGSIAHGWSPIASHCLEISLEPGESRDLVFLLGYVENPQEEKFNADGSINKARAHALMSLFDTTEKVDAAFRELNEAMKWMEKTVASIKEVLKHTYNVGTEEELPPNVKWNKQSYTYDFRPGAAAVVANILVNKKLVAKDALLDTVTVSAMSKASGLTVEKIMDMFPDTIEQKPKARTLNMK